MCVCVCVCVAIEWDHASDKSTLRATVVSHIPAPAFAHSHAHTHTRTLTPHLPLLLHYAPIHPYSAALHLYRRSVTLRVVVDTLQAQRERVGELLRDQSNHLADLSNQFAQESRFRHTRGLNHNLTTHTSDQVQCVQRVWAGSVLQ